MKQVLITVDIGYANFGLISEKGKIVEAAPIANWTVGKTTREILEYYQGKKAKIYIHK